MSFLPKVLSYVGIGTVPLNETTYLGSIKFGNNNPIPLSFHCDLDRKFLVARAYWNTAHLLDYARNNLIMFVNMANSKMLIGAFEFDDDSLSLRFSCSYLLKNPMSVIIPTINSMIQTLRLLAKPIQTCLTIPNTFFVPLIHDQFMTPVFLADSFAQHAFDVFNVNDSSQPQHKSDPLIEIVKSLTKIPKANISNPRKIGEGGFALIYLADYIGTPVVVKRLKKIMSDEVRSMLAAEVGITAKLRHPNIIQLIGIIENPFSLVLEYMPKKNLDQVIREEGKHIKKDLRLNMLLDTSRGMTYLHSQGISHGDLKPLNLFVSSDYHVKVADFGLAVVKGSDEVSQCSAFTPAYAAPEYFRKVSTKQSDIFAFSSTIYFVMTGKNPFIASTSKGLRALIQTGKTPPLKPSQIPKILIKLTQAGWNLDPKKRPPFKKFTDVLNFICSKKK